LVNMLAACTTLWLLFLVNVGSVYCFDISAFPKTLKNVEEVQGESQNIPTWINGYFVRQLCGCSGTGLAIDYYLDCVGSLGIYHINDGSVKYSSRPYNTRATYCLKNGTYDAPAWRTLRSRIDDADYYECKRKNRSLTDANPNLGMFTVENDSVIVHSNFPYMHKINLKNPTSTDTLVFKNEEEDDEIVLYDSDKTTDHSTGTVWFTRLTMLRNGIDHAHIKRYFYKIEKNSQKMIKVGEYIVSTVYTEDCSWRNGNYAFLAYSLEGMVNSIAVTENYIIYWMFQSTFNPCTILKRPDAFPTVPLLDNFDFDSSGILEIVVISKSDETVIIFEDSPLQQFTGHVVNAMETGSDENLQLTMDLITHPLKNYYDTFDMDFMRNHGYMNVNCSTRMIRYILEPYATYSSRITLHDSVDEFVDFPVINPSYYNNPNYSIIYAQATSFNRITRIKKVTILMIRFALISCFHFVIKDHEVTNVLSWKPREANLLPYGMTFLKHPESRFEDDGVLLLTATVTNELKKSVLIVLNATTMEEIGRSVLPVTAPFGYRAMFIYSSSSALYSVFNFYTTILVTLCWCMSVVVPTLPSVQQDMIIGQKMIYPQ
ncbi:Beta,beta-carotene 9',10'-oxygenase, partial [Trichinella sp. T8]